MVDTLSLNGAWKLFLAEDGERNDYDALVSEKLLEAAA